MALFSDAEGLPLKFFIQRDLPIEEQTATVETISQLGGRVVEKVPRAGYILVIPETPEEDRLRAHWTKEDRPERYFVPYTYPEACRIAGKLLKQIFLDRQVPIKMHIHSSIMNVNVRAALSQRIMNSGGQIADGQANAQVILADPNTEIFNTLTREFLNTYKHLESFLWVKKCVERESVIFTPYGYKNPGGRKPGDSRISYTDDDDEHLCHWVAQKIPYKDQGGRTGNVIWQQLAELGESGDPDYAWANRHSWQSWRERYKKNDEALDKIINAIVDKVKPSAGERGQHRVFRQSEPVIRKTRKRRRAFIEETEEDKQDTGQDSPVNLSASQANTANGREENDGVVEDTKPVWLSETQEDWQIKVGDATPPPWSKLRLSKSLEASPRREHFDKPEEKKSTTCYSTNALADIVTKLHDVAEEYRFTVKEVLDYHSRFNDLERTRRRFRRMREFLQELQDSEDDVMK